MNLSARASARKRLRTSWREQSDDGNGTTRAPPRFIRRRQLTGTGKTTSPCPRYVVDHIVPVKRCGADSTENIQCQTTAETKAQDKIESRAPSWNQAWLLSQEFLNSLLPGLGANRATIRGAPSFSHRWGSRMIVVLKVSGKRWAVFMNTRETGHPGLIFHGLCLPSRLPTW